MSASSLQSSGCQTCSRAVTSVSSRLVNLFSIISKCVSLKKISFKKLDLNSHSSHKVYSLIQTNLSVRDLYSTWTFAFKNRLSRFLSFYFVLNEEFFSKTKYFDAFLDFSLILLEGLRELRPNGTSGLPPSVVWTSTHSSAGKNS